MEDAAVPEVTITTTVQLHEWFKKNHVRESKVFLISWKRHTGKPFLTHRQQIEEALCWGWIDTTLRRVDEDRYGRFFVRRGSNAKWSTNTISYAQQLIADNRMQPSGLRAYKRGLTRPIGDSQQNKNATMPPALRDALAKNVSAGKNFALYPPSTKRTLFTWIARAKRPETVQRRVQEVVGMSLKKQKPFTKDK